MSTAAQTLIDSHRPHRTGELILLTGNCVDRRQLATSTQFVLSGLVLADSHTAPCANYSDALWGTAAQATSWLRIEGDELALAFASGEKTFQYHRTFPAVELIGLTLWASQRVMLAYYSKWADSWIDRAGFACDRILLSAPSAHR